MSAITQALRHRADTAALREKLASDIERGIVPLEQIQNIPIDLLIPNRLPQVSPVNMLVEVPEYKPFRYPFGYDIYLAQNRVHWLPDEVPLAEDVKEWRSVLTPPEINLVTQIFRLFTQNDVFVNNVYMTKYPQIFRANELLMMFAAIGNIESTHVGAYSHLLDTLGLPETEYSAFLSYTEMTNKYDYMQSFRTDTLFGTALAMVVFGGMMEGVQLFASFAMLLNFSRDKGRDIPSTMKGMGQIIAWSVRDESLHVEAIANLFRAFMEEFHALINKPLLHEMVIKATKQIILNEWHFVDLAFELGDVPGLEKQQIKDFISFVADRRLEQFGFEPIGDVPENPIPWIESSLNNVEHTNFFENRATAYSRGASRGTWEDAFTAWTSTHPVNHL